MRHARLEAVGGYLEPCSAILGHLEAVLRPLGGLSEAILSHAWLSWAILKAILGYLGLSWSHLGPKRAGWRVFGRGWEASWGHLGPHGSKRGGPSIPVAPSEALKRRLGAVLERSWAPLGRSWGRLGPSWAPLGALLGHLGAILRLPKPIGSEKARMPKTLISPRLLKGFGILEGAVEGSKGTWIRLGAVLGPLGGMSEAILTHLEVYWAILEAILRLGAPLGAILGHLGRCGASSPPPSQAQGKG